MNYIKPQIGGFDFILDDIEFMQASAIEALNAHVSHLAVSQPSFVLSGCEITIGTGSVIEMAAGWAVVDGELLQVDAQSITPTTQEQPVKFEKQEIDITDPESTKTKDNGQTYFAYKKARAVLTLDLSGDSNIDSSTYSLDDGLKYWYSYKDVIYGKQNVIQLVGNWSFQGVRRPYYQKDFNGMVSVLGKTPNVANTNNAYSVTIGTLPVGFRPETDVLGSFITEAGVYVARIASATGEVRILASAIPTANGELVFPKFKGV